MRAIHLLGFVLATACSPKAPHPGAEPFRASDAASAYAAYQAYCGMCPHAETCCLRESDFAAERWSKTSGTYLRAMREYYECQRSEVLYRSDYDPHPLGPSDGFGPMTRTGNTLASCYPRACGDYAETMAAELDRALATPSPHAPAALVSCSPADAP